MRALLLVIFTSGLLLGQATGRRSLVIDHVTVIDMTGAPPQPDRMVAIEGDRIVAIGRSGEGKPPDGAHMVDGRGRFLIPGLWDMHVHTMHNERRDTLLPLFVANGVTGVRDMSSTLSWEDIHRWKREIAAGTLLGPRIVACGRILDGPNPFYRALSLRAATPEEGRRAVESLVEAGAEFIKVYSRLPRDAYFAIAAEAKKQGIPLAGHVPESVTAAEASDAGQKSMEHLLSVPWGCSPREAELVQYAMQLAEKNEPAPFVAHARTAALGYETYDDTRARALFARFVRNGTWQVPTLVLGRIWDYLYDGAYPDRAWLEYVPRSFRQAWEQAPALGKPMPDDVALGKKVFRRHLELVGAMHRAGVRILAGTDTAFPYMVAGFSLHDELSLLVRAGLTPMEALRSATRNPAEYLGKLNSLGTIEEGKIADLVLLEANPLVDIRNTRRIAAVVRGGKLIDKASLQRMLDDVKTLANQR